MFELSFLNTGLLIFAAATVLPLLIWLLAKKKPPQVIFSTLRFIKLSKEQQQNRTKLNNIILLIIRMLIILLVVLSAARPLFRSRLLKPSRKHPPTAIAILLDTSYNMDYLLDSKSWLDRARDALREINKLSNPEDRLVLISSDEAWNNLHAQLYAGAIPEDVIDHIEISFQSLPLEKMLDYATLKLKESQLPNREVYLLSNFNSLDPGKNKDYTINVIPLAEQTSSDNIRCSAAEPIAQLVERGRTQSIRYELSNYGSSERRDVLVKAVVNDVKVAEKFINLPPNQTISDIISFDIRSDGWQQGYIEVLDDRLLHDNRSYFAFSYYLKPKVAVISQRSALPFTLSSLLRIYAGDGGALDIIAPQSVTVETLSAYNLVVLYEPGPLTDRLSQILKGLQQRQTGVLYTLGSEIDTPWKTHLANVFDLKLGKLQASSSTINFFNPHSFITALLSEEQLRRVEVSHYWSSEGTPRGNTLLASQSSALAVLGDNSVLWTWDLNSSSNRLFIEPMFAVFAYRCFQYLGNAIQTSEPRKVGESIVAGSITLPDGRTLELSNRRFILPRPGVYQMRNGEGRDRLIAANIVYQSYEITDYSNDKRFKLLPKVWQSELFRSRMGHDLWKIFLILALLLMLLEIIIVKHQEAKSASKNP